MRWEEIKKIDCPIGNILKGKNLKVFLIVLFSIAFFGTRVPRLANDVINPDGVLWHGRSEQFVVGLKYQQFEKTYQHYHPGVTLMWIVGSSVEIYKQITGITVYNSETFMNFDLVAKSSLVLVQFVLSIILIYSLSKITGFFSSFLTVALFTFEPFFIGTSRILHLDVLSSLLVILALIINHLNIKKPSTFKSIFTGFLLATSFLTKSICIGAFLYVVFYDVFYFISLKRKKDILPIISVTVVSFLVFTFLLFPALWKDPWYYLFEMVFGEAERVGMREGHRQVVGGELKMDGGPLFYPVIFLLKSSPFMVFGMFYYLFSGKKFGKLKDSFKNLIKKALEKDYYFGIFYFGYIAFMTVATKKIDRYIIFMFPLFAYLAAMGYTKIYDIFKKKGFISSFWWVISTTLFVFVAFPIFKIFPWYFTYTSPLFVNTRVANGIIGQKSFGVGVPDLKRLILEKYYKKYGEEPDLGFYDTQPIRAIYPNSKIFDVRVYGPGSYDLLVLTTNEEIPEKVLDSDSYIFEKDSSIYINGLEYWRIYVRKELRGGKDE
jgi:hypothetical protein